MAGLTVEEHTRASGLLSRALISLEAVKRMLRYPRLGKSREKCGRAISVVKMLRQELEEVILTEHPKAGIRYTLPPAPPSSGAIDDAVAGVGDDIASD